MIRAQCQEVQAATWLSMPLDGDGSSTHNWSPLKSPNATTVESGHTPMEPALSSALPLNRFGGKGHIAEVGRTLSSGTRREAAEELNRMGVAEEAAEAVVWQYERPTQTRVTMQQPAALSCTKRPRRKAGVYGS